MTIDQAKAQRIGQRLTTTIRGEPAYCTIVAKTRGGLLLRFPDGSDGFFAWPYCWKFNVEAAA